MEDKGTERLKKIFPDYFTLFKLPQGANEESIKVYRACKTGKCDKISFTPTYEEQGYTYRAGDDPQDPGLYSLSTYENPRHIKRFAAMNSDMHVPYKIAVGYTDPDYGLVLRTKERTHKTTSHVDWWLYQDARPYEAFELIADFEKYLKDYRSMTYGN